MDLLDPDVFVEGRFLSICERSERASVVECLVTSLGNLTPPTLRPAEHIRTAAGSLGGGGRGDLIFPVPVGGGAIPKAFGCFPEAETPPDKPAAESIPVPLLGLGFTLIRIVSPSFNL